MYDTKDITDDVHFKIWTLTFIRAKSHLSLTTNTLHGFFRECFGKRNEMKSNYYTYGLFIAEI